VDGRAVVVALFGGLGREPEGAGLERREGLLDRGEHGVLEELPRAKRAQQRLALVVAAAARRLHRAEHAPRGRELVGREHAVVVRVEGHERAHIGRAHLGGQQVAQLVAQLRRELRVVAHPRVLGLERRVGRDLDQKDAGVLERAPQRAVHLLGGRDVDAVAAVGARECHVVGRLDGVARDRVEAKVHAAEQVVVEDDQRQVGAVLLGRRQLADRHCRARQRARGRGARSG
jgi:hypothetical protein